MRYLLLGGAGFIGTHLAKQLISEGHDVIIVDNCSTSAPPDYAVEFYHEDVAYSNKIDSLIEQSDTVYFLAGSVGVKYVVENPYDTMLNNTALAAKIAPLIAQHQKPVLFASTSEVYGEGPFSETNDLSIGSPDNLRWGYASAKLATEFLIAATGAPHKILRFFNVTGSGQLPDYGMVLPRFVEAALSGEDIVVHGNGSQRRAFCHVKDAVSMLRQLETAESGIYNIGADQEISMLALAELVRSVTGSQSKIVLKALSEVYAKNSGDIDRRVPDLTKIKSSINYQIKYTIEDIIRDML
jgi:UDP-glucose 4-epimerase